MNKLLRYRSQALSGLSGLEHYTKVSKDSDANWEVRLALQISVRPAPAPPISSYRNQCRELVRARCWEGSVAPLHTTCYVR
jgi:hypothetical protein